MFVARVRPMLRTCCGGQSSANYPGEVPSLRRLGTELTIGVASAKTRKRGESDRCQFGRSQSGARASARSHATTRALAIIHYPLILALRRVACGGAPIHSVISLAPHMTT